MRWMILTPPPTGPPSRTQVKRLQLIQTRMSIINPLLPIAQESATRGQAVGDTADLAVCVTAALAHCLEQLGARAV